jgi:hypothetical protein
VLILHGIAVYLVVNNPVDSDRATEPSVNAPNAEL